MSDPEAMQAKIAALESEIGGLKGALGAERTKRQAAEQSLAETTTAATAAQGEVTGLAAQMKSFADERTAFEAFKADATKNAEAWSREKAVIQAGFPIDKAEQVLTIAQSLHKDGDFTEFLAAQKAEPWAQGYLAASQGAPTASVPADASTTAPTSGVASASGTAPQVSAPIVPAPRTAAGTLPAGGPGGQTGSPGSILAAAAADPGAFLKRAMGPGYKLGRLSNGEG
tara:strand:+ start:5569 stop:6252 length:684 start_codon:yes stop_codon:yes gene_type:complete